MAKTREKVIIKNFARPDEVRDFEKGKLELIKVDGAVIGKGTFDPGWRWSTHVKPAAGTPLCEEPHFMYVVSGEMKLLTSDGEEHMLRPGDVVKLGPGHDAWVVGGEPAVLVDFEGMKDYGKRR
ncbi:MAG TPA: cupin domain-containing protein [Elusimicrobiota bacterium]|jgi:quercetin dioxygenase-like cupin family protein|nr:cupin domain-containing protein [Elusimicrobiota bacterium]